MLSFQGGGGVQTLFSGVAEGLLIFILIVIARVGTLSAFEQEKVGSILTTPKNV